VAARHASASKTRATPSMRPPGSTEIAVRAGSFGEGVRIAMAFQESRKAYAAGAATWSAKRPSQFVMAGADQGMSCPRGIPRTATPAAGLPSRSVTRPSMTAGGFCAMRFCAAVTFGADAHAATLAAATPMTSEKARTRVIGCRLYGIIAGMAETEDVHRFEIRAAWSGDALGAGEAAFPEGAPICFAGSTLLGGSGGRANPEELLLTALASCFLNTWAIFLKKLNVGYAEPTLRASCEVGKDPAGGFRAQKASLRLRVPAALYASRRAEVDKTVSLAEKYCIVSKVVRSAMPLDVVIEEA
jgi:organic hydroperoxide reductase OsmC/OhrA